MPYANVVHEHEENLVAACMTMAGNEVTPRTHERDLAPAEIN